MTDEPIRTIKRVLFVVPAHNEELHLERCLRSILAQSQQLIGEVSVSLAVVDNASTDATVEIASQCGARLVHVSPGNPGRARNAGVAASDCEFIAFVDADCVLPEGWLRQGLASLCSKGIVAVGSVQALATVDAPWVERVWVETIVPQASCSWEPVNWLPAFNLLLRRSDFEAVDGFDESLTTCEDSDLSFRLCGRGELRRDHTCPVLHLGESQSLTEFVRRERWRSNGNFRSAFKRGTLAIEFVSLFLPVAYFALLVLTACAIIGGLVFGGLWWTVAGVCLLLVLLAPIGIALVKRKRLTRLPSASLLFAAYLLARGLGPFLPAKRVGRH